jgi:hypothetical protein
VGGDAAVAGPVIDEVTAWATKNGYAAGTVPCRYRHSDPCNDLVVHTTGLSQ